MSDIPRKPTGNGPAASFMQAVWEKLWGTSEKKQTAVPAARGTIIYIKCCLADGSECYVPVVYRGTIYRSNGGTTDPVTVVEEDVPDGYTVLE